jgi:hypothetical protein
MRCQRCGFEIEPGQTFCSMCGTEQSKALRKPDKKIKSILGIIKVASSNHIKMYRNLGLMIIACVFIYLMANNSPVMIPLYCLAALLFLYIFFQCLIPYKNPNASKSKKYKLGVRVSFILIILLVILTFLGDVSLIEIIK